MARFANILHDKAFKIVLFTPENEGLLIDMVELLLPGKHVKSLRLEPTEQQGLVLSDKSSTFDLYCTSETGEMFIVEMQYSAQEHYADRMLCYASFPIRTQMAQMHADLESGKRSSRMDYGLVPIYVVSILNFRIDHEDDRILDGGLVSHYGICSPKTGEVMTDALQFTFVELDRLKVSKDHPEQCRSVLEQFAYSMKYMSELEMRPEGFDEDLLRKLYRASELVNLSIEQQIQLQEVMRTELDRIAEINYAWKDGMKQGREEGREEGRAEERLASAKALLAAGIPLETLVNSLHLSEEEVRKVTE